MKTQYVCVTYFIVEEADHDEAYQTYRGRMNDLAKVEGVEVVSVAKGLRLSENSGHWESLAEQYQIEHNGEYPSQHKLCFVVTVVNVEDSNEAYDQTMEHLIMDDPDVRVDCFPSTVDANTQIML
ncbi:hypothetical protein [Corynebacterium crudilactis]|uniref:Uncharacterized protein n=1 Tax=Corynebacterium crudilactis TaxID=1652495 RepID=A0A172QUH9_9CORY|nr:hypothetical protein [Corynebacterium crudilactis]ANE04369.1 hypothetical protein ccrud_09265 [Corynebacterium crudilactis]